MKKTHNKKYRKHAKTHNSDNYAAMHENSFIAAGVILHTNKQSDENT